VAADGDREGGDPYIFGPTNVAIHRLSVAIELGDATDALRLGGAMDTSPIPPGGADRHAWVHLDLARAYDMKRQDEAALHRLLEAERIAPELTRNHAMAREMVRHAAAAGGPVDHAGTARAGGPSRHPQLKRRRSGMTTGSRIRLHRLRAGLSQEVLPPSGLRYPTVMAGRAPPGGWSPAEASTAL
jgi:hypothetical protein